MLLAGFFAFLGLAIKTTRYLTKSPSGSITKTADIKLNLEFTKLSPL